MASKRLMGVRGVSGARGLETPKVVVIEAGRGYFLGASSSPSYVIVLSVTDDAVVYVDAGSLQRSTSQRWIAEDLIARGGATVQQRAADGGPFADAAKRQAERHGAVVDARSYDKIRIYAAPVDGNADSHWSAGEEYGVVGFNQVTECFEIDARAAVLEGIMADKRFHVRKVDALARCPTN